MSAATCPMAPDFDPLDDGYLADPYPRLDTLREQGPAHYLPTIGYWLVTRYTDIEAIFADPRTYSARIAQEPLLPLADDAAGRLATGVRAVPVLSNLDPPAHSRIRSQLARPFLPRRIATLRPTIARRTNDLVDRFAGRGHADLVAELTFPLPALTMFALLGFPERDTEMLKSWCGDKLRVNWGRPDATYQRRAVEGMAQFWDYCENFVAERARAGEPTDDLTGELISRRASDPDALDDQELASVIFALSFAGHETTSNLIANALRQTLSRPGLWEQLRTQPHQVDAAVEETLRADSSVIAWRRVTTRPVVLGGTELPAGAKLMLALGAANHDPRQFRAPGTFDPARDNVRRHLSFGRGVHFCLGQHLARAEAAIVLATLGQRLPGLRLTPGQRWSYPANISFRGPQRLLAEWEVS